jgi:hypothetical protein
MNRHHLVGSYLWSVGLKINLSFISIDYMVYIPYECGTHTFKIYIETMNLFSKAIDKEFYKFVFSNFNLLISFVSSHMIY